MKSQILSKAIKSWDNVPPLVTYPKNDKEFETLVLHLDELLNIVGDNENHPLMRLIDIVSEIITAYEDNNFKKLKNKKIPGTSIGALKFLMTSHNLNQSDLSEIGSQGVISEILGGKCALNLRQIKLLSERFNVDPVTFIDN